MYSVFLEEEVRRKILSVDKSLTVRFVKAIAALRVKPAGRHLRHGADCFVVEMGQYRIAYRCDEKKKEKLVVFIGDHKEYEKWYSGA